MLSWPWPFQLALYLALRLVVDADLLPSPSALPHFFGMVTPDPLRGFWCLFPLILLPGGLGFLRSAVLSEHGGFG